MKHPSELWRLAGSLALVLIASTLPLAAQKNRTTALSTVKQVAANKRPEASPTHMSTRAASDAPDSAASKASVAQEVYRIGPGDVLQVSVWKEPQASVQSAIVRSDGRISLPLVKEVYVLGMTPAEVEIMLAVKYMQFIQTPEVSVIVQDIRSEKVYVIGGVKKQGSVNLYGPMTILQVLAEAGGLSEYAKKSEIYVLRTEEGKHVRLPFDYSAQLKGRSPEMNALVRPGDTIVVPD